MFAIAPRGEEATYARGRDAGRASLSRMSGARASPYGPYLDDWYAERSISTKMNMVTVWPPQRR